MPSLKAMAREAQKKPKSVTPKRAPNRKQTVFKSTERVADSDLESETESESGSDSEDGSTLAPAPVAKLNGLKQNPVVASAEAESEEDDDEDVESEDQVEAAISSDHDGASVQSVTESENERESERESNEGNESESEPDEEHEHGKVRVDAETISSHLEEGIQVKSDKPGAVPTYNPPDGFTILPESSEGKRRVAEMFGLSNLAGKQLWYITAPVSVPISAVKQVSLEDVKPGKLAMCFSGREYGFVRDQRGEFDSTKVLIPEGSSNAYHVGQKTIDQTLHLQQIVQLHKMTKSGSLESKISAKITKSPGRKQPEGLKMRFRPIGFGRGKTGTIGFSSPSDADEEMEDARPVPRQFLDLNQANTRLSEHAPKANESQDDTSSSGEETIDPPRKVPADSQSDTNCPSSTSNGEMEELPKSMSTPKKTSNSPPRPLKRKLSDFKKEEKSSSTLYENSKVNGMPLKTANVKISGPASAGSTTKINGYTSITEPKIPSILPSKITKAPLHLGSEIISSHVENSNLKMGPILPPRQSAILPPARGSKSPDVTRAMKAAGARPETSPVKSADNPLPLDKADQRSLVDHLRSTDPALGKKDRPKEIHRLKKNDASHKSKQQRRESMTSATNDTIAIPINASLPSRNDRQDVFKASSPTQASPSKDLSQDLRTDLTTSVENPSKKSKKHTSNSTNRNQTRDTSRPSQEVSKTVLSTGKKSVILPPKFARPLSR